MELDFSHLPVEPVHVAGFGGQDFDVLKFDVLESFLNFHYKRP
jgi:hypothetical protein